MKFKQELYYYQKDILNVFEKERERGDKKIHIVAPPGAGKTIVGLEMISRLDLPTLILVPNITLQCQWKDKLEKLFLEGNENIEEIVSTDVNSIKKINIITYQSLTQTGEETDVVATKIRDSWYNDFKKEFADRSAFDLFIEGLKETNIGEYAENVSKYKKKLKISEDFTDLDNMLSEKVKTYFEALKKGGIGAIVVDEAHHLTSWWSKVIFFLWNKLGSPYIIGLTATPPFDDVDFFDLDDSYANLLGEVDYYIPTPAIVKSGRLAPYNDLVYFVEPGEDLNRILESKEVEIKKFIELNKSSICNIVFKEITEHYDNLIKNNYSVLNNYLKFIYTFGEGKFDITNFMTEETVEKINIEDLAKSTGKWITKTKIKKSGATFDEESIKRLFFDLGYIWRATNFYRFQTPVEKLLIYSKSKMIGVRSIIKKEIENLGGDLKLAIITDFLSAESDYINCQHIFEELKTEFANLNPYLVSGQGIWKIGSTGETLLVKDENILSITEKLISGETKLIIGTKGILGEGWDCPALNALIDLTGFTAYMSVNQVRGRAIRKDPLHDKKTSNVYDIVCIGEGYQGLKDLSRLEGKHEKFYGVNDAGIVVKGVDHIFPNIKEHYSDKEKINSIMLRKSEMRSAIYDLWGIGGEYANKEVFGLNMEVRNAFEEYPIFFVPIYRFLSVIGLFKATENIKDLTSTLYFSLVLRFVREFVSSIMKSMKETKVLPEDFTFDLAKDSYGNIKLISKYKDEFISKGFINFIAKIFSPITTQKYVLDMPFGYFDGKSLTDGYFICGLPDELCKRESLRDSLRKNIFETIYKAPWLYYFFNAEERDRKKMYFKVFNRIFYSYLAIMCLLILGYNAGVTFISVELLSNMLVYPLLGIPAGGLLWTISVLIYGIFGIMHHVLDKIGVIGYFKNKIPSFFYFKRSRRITREKDIKFIYLNSELVEKKDYVSKAPFIIGKIEKLWI